MPLSNPEVISLLNRCFVPVYIANDDYREGGAAPEPEQAELRRIHREGHAAKLSVGTVHAYVLSPDGRLLDTLHVAEAFKVDRLLAMLRRAIARLDAAPGEPVVLPASQSVAAAGPDELLLHVVARYLERRGDRFVLVENAGGNWSAFPGEDWVTLGREQWSRLLPPGPAHPGQSWELDREVTALLLHRFYPPTENNDLAKNRIEEQRLRATVVSVTDGTATARLEGRLRMGHPFYHREDGRFVEAELVGYMEFDPARKRILSLRLVTDEATYGDGASRQPFGAALRSAAPARP